MDNDHRRIHAGGNIQHTVHCLRLCQGRPGPGIIGDLFPVSLPGQHLHKPRVNDSFILTVDSGDSTQFL